MHNIIKKVFALILVVALILTTGCFFDKNPRFLVGKWKTESSYRPYILLFFEDGTGKWQHSEYSGYKPMEWHVWRDELIISMYNNHMRKEYKYRLIDSGLELTDEKGHKIEYSKQ